MRALATEMLARLSIAAELGDGEAGSGVAEASEATAGDPPAAPATDDGIGSA
jgi:hypothetical protein